MKKINVQTKTKKLPDSIADLLTPVSIYLKLRDRFPNTLLLESSDYHGANNSMSYICFNEITSIEVNDGVITRNLPNNQIESELIKDELR